MNSVLNLTTAPATSAAARNRTLRIGLLGCGTIGSAVARLLLDEAETIEQCSGVRPILTTALVRDTRRDRGLPSVHVTDDFDSLLRAKPSVVIEAIGGITPAEHFVSKLLRAGVSVASANKTLVAHHGPALTAIAARAGASFVHEAAICAAVPVLDMARQLRGEPIRRVVAILNGTCNCILTHMERHGSTLDTAINEAQQRGLAEPDPSADLSGRDSAEKLIILARALGWESVELKDVAVHGIAGIRAEDVRFARRRGYSLRLLATIDVDHGQPQLRIAPTLIPRSHRLASLTDAENGIEIETSWRGRLFTCGVGAGPRPTAAALLGDALVATDRRRCAAWDIQDASRSIDAARDSHQDTNAANTAPRSRYLACLDAKQMRSPDTFLNVLNTRGIEIADIEWTNGRCVFMTRHTPDDLLRSALGILSGDHDVAPFMASILPND